METVRATTCGIALWVALAAGACSDGMGTPTGPTGVTPTGPGSNVTETVPNVAGTYIGTGTLSVDDGVVVTFGVTWTIEQTGNRISGSGTTDTEGIVMRDSTGTIQPDGTVTDLDIEPLSTGCGEDASEIITTQFFPDGTARMTQVIDAGLWRRTAGGSPAERRSNQPLSPRVMRRSL